MMFSKSDFLIHLKEEHIIKSDFLTNPNPSPNHRTDPKNNPKTKLKAKFKDSLRSKFKIPFLLINLKAVTILLNRFFLLSFLQCWLRLESSIFCLGDNKIVYWQINDLTNQINKQTHCFVLLLIWVFFINVFFCFVF